MTVVAEDSIVVAEAPPPVARTRSRRAGFEPATQLLALPRDIEFAYIRSDLRRLLGIAAGLFALMLVILVAVNR
jgi:hypothetical protein